jgi:hypothetical protein
LAGGVEALVSRTGEKDVANAEYFFVGAKTTIPLHIDLTLPAPETRAGPRA